MEEGLKIRIGADVSGLEQGVNQAQQALRKVTPATNQAQFALSNLSRVAQDAPFGFIAIQNNLDPLIQSFGQLKQSAGGTGAALRALFSSLAGPAGIALGFAAVSSAATALIQKYGSLGAAFEALARSGDKFFQQQQQLREIQQDAAKDAGEEIARLDVLNKAAQDNTSSLENRREAANKLLDVYKEYLPKLTEEAILNGQAADAINKAKDAILNKALAAAGEKKLADIGAKVLDNQLAQVAAVRQYASAQDELRKQQIKAAQEGVKGIASVNTSTLALSNIVDGARGNLEDLGKEAVSLQKEYDTLLSLVSGFAQRAGDAFIKSPKLKIDVPAAQRELAQRPVIVPAILKVAGIEQSVDSQINRQFAAENSVQIPITIPGVPPSVIESFRKFGEVRKNALDLENFKKQVAEFRQLLQIGLAQPLGDLIFNFLDQGKVGFKEFADAAIASIKRIVAQLIATKLIQLIGNLVAPGAGGLLGGLFSAGGFGPSANLSGLGGGGLQLFGQVSLAARGTDLVGVISQSNARIGRVG